MLYILSPLSRSSTWPSGLLVDGRLVQGAFQLGPTRVGQQSGPTRMAGIRQGDVVQLLPLAGGAQHQRAPPHVAGADELTREEQPVAEHRLQQVDVLAGRD